MQIMNVPELNRLVVYFCIFCVMTDYSFGESSAAMKLCIL